MHKITSEAHTLVNTLHVDLGHFQAQKIRSIWSLYIKTHFAYLENAIVTKVSYTSCITFSFQKWASSMSKSIFIWEEGIISRVHRIILLLIISINFLNVNKGLGVQSWLHQDILRKWNCYQSLIYLLYYVLFSEMDKSFHVEIDLYMRGGYNILFSNAPNNLTINNIN